MPKRRAARLQSASILAVDPRSPRWWAGLDAVAAATGEQDLEGWTDGGLWGLDVALVRMHPESSRHMPWIRAAKMWAQIEPFWGAMLARVVSSGTRRWVVPGIWVVVAESIEGWAWEPVEVMRTWPVIRAR